MRSLQVHAHHLNVTNPLEPNADGIDVDSSQGVLIEDSHLNVGDDALCVKSGIDYFGRAYGRASKDIVFRNNVIGTGHGITIGSEMSGGIRNVTFENITMAHTGTGIRMKSMRGRGGEVSDITYRNINMLEIDGQCVQMTLNYGKADPTNTSATPVFDGIVIEDVYCGKSSASFFLDGLPEQSIKNVSFRNVTMGPNAGREASCKFIDCRCDNSPSCPSCCAGAQPGPPTPPVAKPCKLVAEIGCFDVSGGAAAVLPTQKSELHDRVTLEGCAGLCNAAGQLAVAGIDGGNHCSCGPAGAVQTPTAARLARPMTECKPTSCPHRYSDKCSCTGNTTEQ